MNLSFCVPCSTSDASFGSWASPIIHQSRVLYKISSPSLGSWFPPLGSQVLGPDPTYELDFGFWVSVLTFGVPGLKHKMGPGSRISGLTKSPRCRVPLSGCASNLMNFISFKKKFIVIFHSNYIYKWTVNFYKLSIFLIIVTLTFKLTDVNWLVNK